MERTPDPAKEYLKSVREAKSEQNRLRQKICSLDTKLYNITSHITGMPRTGTADPEATRAALLDLKGHYTEELIEAERQEREVEAFIAGLPSPDCRIVLRHRYLEGLSWPKVLRALEKDGIYYEERQMYRVHGAALNEARELWKETHSNE